MTLLLFCLILRDLLAAVLAKLAASINFSALSISTDSINFDRVTAAGAEFFTGLVLNVAVPADFYIFEYGFKKFL